MVTALLQLRDAIEDGGHLYLFSVLVALIWFVWLVKVLISRRYAACENDFRTTSSVVIPVVDEPIDLFRDVLSRIAEQEPTEVLVVINGPRNPSLESACAEFPLVQWEWTPIAGKRNALRVGIEKVTGEVVVLVDSDTLWTEGTLEELLKPFADRRIGGVTTRQRILDPDRNFLTRWADWLESSRSLYSMPAQSVLGQVGCLPGRTIAFRRDVLEDIMPDFLTQKFLGVVLEVSDDRTLTNLTLKQGYKTVYQSTSVVYTDCPTGLKKMAKQQYRWARGSQYNTLRMLPWMTVNAPILGFFFCVDVLIPFLWICSAIRMGDPLGHRLPRESLRRHSERTPAIPTSSHVDSHRDGVVGLHVHPPAAASRAAAGRHRLDAGLCAVLDSLPPADPPLWLCPDGKARWVGNPRQRIRRR